MTFTKTLKHVVTSEKTLKHIVVSEKNYQILKNLGRAGDSFNDVLTKILGDKN